MWSSGRGATHSTCRFNIHKATLFSGRMYKIRTDKKVQKSRGGPLESAPG